MLLNGISANLFPNDLSLRKQIQVIFRIASLRPDLSAALLLLLFENSVVHFGPALHPSRLE